MNLFVPGFAFVTLTHIEGHPTPDGQAHTVQFRRISEGYFRTLRIPQRRGRAFDGRDGAGGLPVAVVTTRTSAAAVAGIPTPCGRSHGREWAARAPPPPRRTRPWSRR